MYETKEELEARLAKQRAEVLTDIRRANRDLPRRVRASGVTFDLDTRRDILTVSIGTKPHDFYTQGVDDFYLDFDLETDLIVGFTILDFEREFLKAHHVLEDDDARKFFEELLPLLLEYGTLSFPPERKGTSKVGEALKTFTFLRPHSFAH